MPRESSEPIGVQRMCEILTNPTGTAVTLMEKQLRLAAARIWGKTGSYREDPELMARLLDEIHDDLVGISAAFRNEIGEVWGDYADPAGQKQGGSDG